MMLTETELSAIEARANAATRGPWFAHNPDDSMYMNVLLVSDSPVDPDTECPLDEVEYGKIIALTLFQAPRIVDHDSGLWYENAEFIAEVRRLRARLAEVEGGQP